MLDGSRIGESNKAATAEREIFPPGEEKVAAGHRDAAHLSASREQANCIARAAMAELLGILVEERAAMQQHCAEMHAMMTK